MSAIFDQQLFSEFFVELNGRAPFPWQLRLARQVVEEGWPAVIDLPTASGKTACIDIAVFALASGNGARRIFFVVDRKVIVDEAYRRVERMAARLASVKEGPVKVIADQLRALSGDIGGAPLRCAQLRGGIFRDESWVKTPLQATVVTSTVDQIGSRLLFRGYGISRSSQPIHAGMIGNDALLLLDEAHCSKPFAQTLDRVQRYQGAAWRTESGAKGVTFVEMTATPSRNGAGEPFQLGADDWEHEELGRRLRARKMTRWVSAKAKTDDPKKLAPELIREARAMAQKDGVKRIAVMVNRVETARAVASGLEGEAVTLVIGRMRPEDRKMVESELSAFHSGVERNSGDPVRFTVSTQCLEVGADLDFDALVTELASMDALLQRFGRLNRLGKFPGGAWGCIVAPTPDAKQADAIYGEALPATRTWLEAIYGEPAEHRDFGIASATDTLPALWRELPRESRMAMSPAAPVCPTLLPAHLDALVQTSPRPEPEPAVEYFLHGKQAGSAEVSVAWRSELDEETWADWASNVEMCPPVTGEALPVKIWAVRAWMEGRTAGSQSELEGVDGSAEPPSWRTRTSLRRAVAIWRDGMASVTDNPKVLRPGDAVLLPATVWPIPEFGYVPPGAATDVGDAAYLSCHDKLRLRLHPAVVANWPNEPRTRFAELLRQKGEDLLWSDVRQAAGGALDGEGLTDWWRGCLVKIREAKIREFTLTPYPSGAGWVIESRMTLRQMLDDDGRDLPSRGEAVSLSEHTANVERTAGRFADRLVPNDLASVIRIAAKWHDTGKLDERFQVMLFGGDTVAAQLSPAPRAKGDWVMKGWQKRGLLPEGFRHELVSLLLAEQAGVNDELALHLIASHHGYCRPFAPVVLDEEPSDLVCGDTTVRGEERKRRAPHRLDVGVADRFWRLNRRYGWWGLAYLEALLRLGDWRASALEQEGHLPGAKEEANG